MRELNRRVQCLGRRQPVAYNGLMDISGTAPADSSAAEVQLMPDRMCSPGPALRAPIDQGGTMLRIALAAFLVVCLMLSACKTVMPTPLLEVQEQSVEDATVVFRAAIDMPGWLVLHPATPAGELDVTSELARVYLPDAGEYASITMGVGGVVVGDADVFTYTAVGAEDPPVTVEDSEVTVSFTMQGITPYVEVEVTGTGEGVVTIEVAIDKPGWLVLHPPTLEGEPDADTVLARTYLADAGIYPGFEVTVPAGTYYPVLHYDDPADAEFTFVSGGTGDPPVRVGGIAVEEAFTVGE